MQISIRLEPSVIHIVRVQLDAPPLGVDEMAELVTADERRRAEAFHQMADAHRHIIGRGVARLVLGGLLGVAPHLVPFAISSFGKPTVPGGPSFNIGHSGNEILVAFADRGRVGVDVEAIRPLDDLHGLARASFVSAEVEVLQSLPDAAQLRHFYRVWARKEAMLKALGVGIGSLSSVQVSGALQTDNALLRMTLPGEDAGAWVIRPLECGEAVEAAVAWDQPLKAVVLIPLS